MVFPWKRFAPLLSLTVFAIAVWLLYHEISQYHWHEIEQSLATIAYSKIGLAACLVLVNYCVLIGYDWLALKAIGVRLDFLKVSLASFTGFVASYNFGATLGGIPVRYRVYTLFGLKPIQIVELSVMLGVTFWIGEFALAGLTFVLSPIPVPTKLHLPFSTTYYFGWVLIALASTYFAATLIFRRSILIAGHSIRLPSPKMTLAQFAVASSDFLLAAATLYILLPSDIGVHYFQFVSIFLLASIAVVLTHIPGGLGIFELVILTMLGAEANSGVIASLLVFRVIYYLIPLFIAGVLVGSMEYWRKRDWINPFVRQVSHATTSVAPTLVAGIVLLGGAILLISGATPSTETRLQLLRSWFPLPFIEVSHFVGSILGVAMLFVARGLQRKLDSAWWIAILLSSLGIITSLVKGFDYEEAILLVCVIFILILSRKRFYRKGFLLHQKFTPTWIAAISSIVLISLWLGAFAYKHVEYRNELWWRFAFQADAPRFLRANVGVAIALFCFTLWNISRHTKPKRTRLPTADELTLIDSIVNQSTRTNASLGLLGDKQFLFSDDRTAFIMYAIEQRSWIAMGDPVGPESQHNDLIWKFRELCDRYDGWPVFYQVEKQNLSLYLDQGLTLLKIGEEARVRLSGFSIEGQHKSLRFNRNKLTKNGCQFEVLPKESVPGILPELRIISNHWLADKKTAEKGFSLGFFSEDYLMRFPIAIVRFEGQIIAFANILQGANNEELSIDLMRYRSGGPNGLMDFLFTELMLWGKAEGFQWFNMGMAPLSGLDNRPLAPLWNKAINLVYRHGDHFYSFEGLRQYKDKFDPIWQSKYLASPGGIALPRILADLARLIGRKKRW